VAGQEDPAKGRVQTERPGEGIATCHFPSPGFQIVCVQTERPGEGIATHVTYFGNLTLLNLSEPKGQVTAGCFDGAGFVSRLECVGGASS